MTEIIKDWLQIGVSLVTLVALCIGIAMQARTLFNIDRLERNTNSIQDALNIANREAGELSGEKRGREEEIAKQEQGRTT